MVYEHPLPGEADALANYFSAARLARDVLWVFYALAEAFTKGD